MAAKVRAPEFPEGMTWVNTAEPPTIARLKGRVVALHFWHHSSIHAQHVLRDLRTLENKYHDGLTVIGVHTAKFTGERDPQAVLKAVNRLHIRYPVVSDPEYWLWQMYGVHAWPTVAVLDASGDIAGLFAGEGRLSELDALIGELLEEAQSRDARVYDSLPPASRPEARSALRFPGKVLATHDLLYVADSGNNRILETSHDGRTLRQFGSGNAGFWDGRLADSGFNDPQGMVLVKDSLYVADTGNHAIRRIRLLSGEVDTVAGNGTQSHVVETNLEDPTRIPLNSPLDLSAAGDRIFIAMAGQHQIWSLDLLHNRIGVYAGTGRFGMDDGEANGATFAKPSGLAVNGPVMYVADSDNSAIRALRVADGQVNTLVGAGMWEFGDKDGLQPIARLQGPLGLCTDLQAPILWIADTLNNKLRALSLRGSGLRTLMVRYKFQEPSGISSAAGSLWIANTNAHEIVRLDSSNGAIRRVPIGE